MQTKEWEAIIKLNAHNVAEAVAEMLYKCYGNIQQKLSSIESLHRKRKKASTIKSLQIPLNIPFIKRTDFVPLSAEETRKS